MMNGYEKQKKQLETLIRIAKKAKCKYIRIFSFSMVQKIGLMFR